MFFLAFKEELMQHVISPLRCVCNGVVVFHADWMLPLTWWVLKEELYWYRYHFKATGFGTGDSFSLSDIIWGKNHAENSSCCL